MALPTTIWYILFCFLPMFGLIIAFKNYKVIGGKSFIYNLIHSEWAGVKNFMFLIKSNDLFVILRNTILYNLVFIVPVSYTHLDVYKRQPIVWAELRQIV